MTYFFSVPSSMILLQRATCKGCSVALFASSARFHCAGSARPVSSSLMPVNLLIFSTISLFSSSSFLMDSEYGPSPQALNKLISASSSGMYFFSFFSQAIQTFFKLQMISNQSMDQTYKKLIYKIISYFLLMGAQMPCCCNDSTVSKEGEIVYNKGSNQNERQLQEFKKQTAEKSINTEAQSDHRAQRPAIGKEEYDQRLRKLNQLIERQQLRLKQQGMKNIRIQQQLKRLRQSSIRTNRNAQQNSLVERQRQLQRQRQAQQNKKLLRQLKQRENSIQQRQKSIQSTVKSLYERKILQSKQDEEKRLNSLKSLLLQRQQELLLVQTQSKTQNAKFIQNQGKLKSEIYSIRSKVASYEQQIQKLQKQLQQEKKQSNLKNQKLQQIRYNQLFQNDIFSGRQNYKQYLTNSLQDRYNRRIIKTKLLYRYDQSNKLNFHKSIDQLPSIAVIVRLSNGYYVAGYSEGPFIPKVAADRDALLISLTNKRIFYLAEQNRKGITYDDYYIIFGNSELRLRSQQNRVFSNFGISNGYFSNRGQTVNILFGEGNQREVDLSYYEIYQVFFESI